MGEAVQWNGLPPGGGIFSLTRVGVQKEDGFP